MEAGMEGSTNSDKSLGQLMIHQGSPKSFGVLPNDKTTTESAPENSDDTTKGVLQRRTMFQRIQILPAVFNASIFAAHIPFVSAADAGDDFSNNLFTDLAPILALFGEQVAKQYMSQSMGWVEDLIFACAPLGIITAMVGAIRVGGPGVLQAIIGRARESRGVVEVELMSSTSADVCELWDGQGVVRVLGSSPIIELYYLQRDPGNASNPGVDGDSIPLLEYSNLEEDTGIWDFVSAIFAGQLKGNSPGSRLSASEEEGLEVVVPNIGLNLSGQRVSESEFMLVAAVGVVLQAGVVVFAAAVVYLPPWNERFRKDGNLAEKHGFPSMAGGTVALVIGMFLCCLIVERSTTKRTWVTGTRKRGGHRVVVAWLQKGGEVNDQHFKSYILHRPNPKPSKLSNALRKLMKTSSNPDTRLHIRTSHKGSPKGQGYLVVPAVVVSLAGFILQFVGLRALTWQVTIAQLIAIGAMTGLRALVRRNLVHKPEGDEIKVSGYELEAMAMKITDCDRWDVTTWNPGSEGGLIAIDSSPGAEPSSPTASGGPGVVPDGFRFASKVMNARGRLGELSMWSSECQITAGIVVQAIEASMDFLWANPDINFLAERPADTFEWKLFVEVSKALGGEDYRGPTATFVKLGVSRKILPNGAWGPWRAVRNEIEAVLGLWVHHLKLQPQSGLRAQNRGGNWREARQGMGGPRNYRTVGNGDPSNKAMYQKWLLPQTELVTISQEDIIGRPNTNRAQYLAVLSETSLEKICGQHIFSTFLANIVDIAVDSLNGKVIVRGSEQGIRDLFGLRNTVIDGLVNEVERSGLANPEDALLSIVPALGGKYSTSAATTEAFSDLASQISTYLEGSRFEQAEALLLWLLDTTESDAKHHEDEQKWKEACKSYILLLKTYIGIRSESYARRAEEAIGLFCERFHSSHQAGGGEATRETLDIIEKVWGEMKMSSWEENRKKLETRLERREQATYSERTGTACERLFGAAASGDYLRVMSELQNAEIDINSHDSKGRTSLILACLSGHANIAIQLLRGGADPCLKDRYGKTAIHYAARKNDTSALHALLLHEKAGTVINADGDRESPLQISVQSSAGAAVALLIFYGAEDPEGRAKECLGLSAHLGSYKAVRVALGKGSKDEKYGRAPLHWAVWRGEAAAVELMRPNNVEVEAKGDDGLTALHLAARCGCDPIVKLLIRQLNADRDAKDRDGKMALHLACAGGHESTADMLIRQFGADVNAKAKGGETGLYLASAGGHDSITEFLVRQHGADVNAETKNAGTALHLACEGGHDSTVELLIRHLGAEVNAETKDGKTALHLACAGAHDSTAELLVRRLGAEVNAKTKDGETALHLACAGGHDSTAELLVQHLGAEVNAKTKDGQTALHLACAGGHDSTAQLLIMRFNAQKSYKDRSQQTASFLLVKYM